VKVVLRTAARPVLRAVEIVARPFLAVATKALDRAFPTGDAPAPVFIVGAPRSGSTILYQALSNALDVLYIDNLTSRFYFNLFVGFWISRRLYGNRPHGNFQSHHGDTKRFGGHAPSECGIFWYQWLPRNRHFVDHGEIPPRSIAKLRFAVCFPSRWFGRPVLFKNLNVSQRLRLISEAFPDARIIYLKRDLDRTVASILRARRAVGHPAKEIWSVRPRDYREIEALPEEEMCRAQVRMLEAQIETDVGLFCENNVFTVRYEDLSPDLIETLRVFIGVDYRARYALPDFRDAQASSTGAAQPVVSGG